MLWSYTHLHQKHNVNYGVLKLGMLSFAMIQPSMFYLVVNCGTTRLDGNTFSEKKIQDPEQGKSAPQ